MRVGMDARVLSSRVSGGPTYVRNVIHGLSAVDPGGDYTLFLHAPLPPGTIRGAERMRHVVVPPHSGRMPNPLSFSLALARTRIDVAHAQYMAPWLWPV